MKLQEIETVSRRFKVCPRCNSREGFWLGMKGDHIHVQCKCCGASFELVERCEKQGKLRFFGK